MRKLRNKKKRECVDRIKFLNFLNGIKNIGEGYNFGKK